MVAGLVKKVTAIPSGLLYFHEYVNGHLILYCIDCNMFKNIFYFNSLTGFFCVVNNLCFSQEA